MRTPEETKMMLHRFVGELEGLSFPSSPISLELAEFVAGSIRDFLNGDASSLDKAFGLTPRRGAPGNPEKRRAIAEELLALRDTGMSWKDIADQFHMQDRDVTDERTLRAYLSEFYGDLISDSLIKRLNGNE
ncbi:MAG: hypothetical protein ABW088_05280 [Sedimenticola sp.]